MKVSGGMDMMDDNVKYVGMFESVMCCHVNTHLPHIGYKKLVLGPSTWTGDTADTR
jgi:hypothetical protein